MSVCTNFEYQQIKKSKIYYNLNKMSEEHSVWKWFGEFFYSNTVDQKITDETTVVETIDKTDVKESISEENPTEITHKQTIKLYTAIFGNYDTFSLPVAQTNDMEFYAFLDNKIEVYKYENQNNPVLISTLEAYDFSVHEIFSDWENKPSQYVIKNIILRFLGPQIGILESDILIYMDGNVRIRDPNFLKEKFVNPIILNPDKELFLSQHPVRTCFRKEIDASKKCAKYANSDLEKMKSTYASLKDNAGLYWNGLLGYNLIGKKTNRIEAVAKLNTFLQDYLFDSTLYAFDKNKLYWPQCQINLPGLIHKHQINIHVLPAMYFSLIVPHAHK
jgi:hypothetical protein